MEHPLVSIPHQQLAAGEGDDDSGGLIWWRVYPEVLPQRSVRHRL
jgi:hypothetical protein